MRTSANAEVKSIESELDSRYGSELSDSDRVREFIALASERQVKKGPVASFINNVKMLVAKGLRALGIDRPFGMTDIQEILKASRTFIQDPSNRVDSVVSRDLQEENGKSVDSGLPMSDEDRVFRAQDLGFDTDNVMYQSGTVGGAAKMVPVYDSYSTGVNPTYLRTKNAMEITADQDINQAVIDAREEGFDSVVVRGEEGIEQVLVFDPNNIRSTKSPFNPSYQSSSTLYSSREDLTDEQQLVLSKIGRPASAVGRVEAFKMKYQETTSRINIKMRQGVFDQYNSFRNILNDEKAWMMSHLTKSSTSAVEAAIDYGQVFLEDGAIGVNTNTKGLKEAIMPLGTDLDTWLGWMAGNRAQRLLKEGRENLFNQEEINVLKGLNVGKEALFEQARKDFEALNASVTQIAVDTGLVDQAAADMWAEEGFYLPFYRVMNDAAAPALGPNVKSGALVRQQAFQQLKGGTDNINDLLENVMMNWNHLITSSLNNQAARQALSSAVAMGIAKPISRSTDGNIAVGEEFALEPAAQRVTMEEAGNMAVYVKIGGKNQWYALDDSTDGQLVMESLMGLNWNGLNGGTMKAMRMFKHALTTTVTVSPEFKIRNLIRDSIQAAAATGASANIAKNMYQGFKATSKSSEAYAQAVAGGGVFTDSGYIYGADPEAIRYALRKGVGRDTILDTRWRIKQVFDKYQDWGARGENINRMAEYQQALNDNRGTRLTRAFNSRDHIDFTRTGSFVAIRAIAQMVPFFNARLQGLSKLGRAFADPESRKKLAVVGGTYVGMSILGYLAIKDDDDYKELEEWEKDTYHHFKIPGSELMYRIPRPFEIGAIASLSERVVEQMVDDEVHGTLFAERLGHALSHTFSFNPTPQMVRPGLEVAMNKNWFTQRPIESQSMADLSPENRKRAWTSETAIAMSQGMAAVLWEDVTLSPVQVEHLVRGYLGWAGATTLSSIDMLVTRPVTDSPVPPATHVTDYPIIRTLVKTMPNKNTKYTTMFYERLGDINRAFADIRQAQQLGDMKTAIELNKENLDLLSLRKTYQGAQRDLSSIGKEMSRIRLDSRMNAGEKQKWMDMLTLRKNSITMMVGQKTDRRMNDLDEN